jgi:membrane associated rhomboid family serine protease
MDWSLVLTSQGIGHSVEWVEAKGWILSVAPADAEKAATQIRLYRLENRHWRWHHQVWQSDSFFDWSSLVWVWLNIFFYGWSTARENVRIVGEMDGAALVRGEWWRLLTATWLHANLAHLAMNLVFGFLFLGLVMGRFGPGMGLLTAYLAGIGGNLAAWLVFGSAHRGLGSSGVVMGALGLLAIQAPALLKRRNTRALRIFAAGLLAGVLLFVFLGTDPEADVIAHLGGFVSGILLGLLLSLSPGFVRRPGVNFAAGILSAVLIILPWWLAWKHAGSNL